MTTTPTACWAKPWPCAPWCLLSGEILKDPALKAKFGPQAEKYLRLADQVYEKWDRRGAWRETKDGGIIPVVLPFGIDAQTGKWTNGYEQRNAPGKGFSHPNNKANHVARWLLAMSDVTGKPVYRERAEKWFQVMKSRMKLKPNGTYEIWNYWEPAGPWDYKPDGSPKHWVGVHPNPGYYQIDVTGIVDAHRHGLVFTRSGHRPPDRHRPCREAVLGRPGAVQPRHSAEVRGGLTSPMAGAG